MRGLTPGEILHVGPYRTQLVDVQEDGRVVVRAIFQSSLLHKQATVKLVPTEKYLELRELAFKWEQLDQHERAETVFKNGFDHASEIGR